MVERSVVERRGQTPSGCITSTARALFSHKHVGKAREEAGARLSRLAGARRGASPRDSTGFWACHAPRLVWCLRTGGAGA